MTQTTDNLLTPFPETTDLADVPKNMRDIAVSWENAFGARWQTWDIAIAQGTTASGEQAFIGLDAATLIARSFKTGKTVYAQAYATVSVGTGLVGYVMFRLPYPMVSADETAGIIISRYSATSYNIVQGIVPIVGPLSGDPGWVYEHIATPVTRVATDWFGLLLRYETV